MEESRSNRIPNERGGRKSDKGRRMWTPEEEAVLINALKELLSTGWKADNGFRAGYIKQLEQAMLKEFPTTDLRGEPNISSKLHVWKKHYGTLNTMLNLSGFGWNSASKTITVDDDAVWEQHVKKDPAAKMMRHKSWPHYDAWCEIFEKERPRGDAAADAADIVNQDRNIPTTNAVDECGEVNVEEDSVCPNLDDILLDNDVNQEAGAAPTANSVQSARRSSINKRKRATDSSNDKMVEVLDRYCAQTYERLGQIAERIGYDMELQKRRAQLFDAIAVIGGLTRQDQFKAIQILGRQESDVDIFFGLPESEREDYVRMKLLGLI